MKNGTHLRLPGEDDTTEQTSLDFHGPELA